MSADVASIHDDQLAFGFLFAFRIINALTLTTFFQPDEYYQALEPAWNFTLGHSGAWITWEWMQHIRPAIHPAIFSAVYYLADLISPSSLDANIRDGLIISAPKVLQAFIAATGDYYTLKLSSRVYANGRLTWTSLCLTVFSPWQWFCSTRTFSNGLEHTLTVAALYEWPFTYYAPLQTETSTHSEAVAKKPELPSKTGHLRRSLFLAATAVVIRPTNILIWAILATFLLSGSSTPMKKATRKATAESHTDKLVVNQHVASKIWHLMREVVVCGGIVLGVSAVIDRAFYGVWTLPAANFLYFNVVQSLAVFYGNNNWHYYFSEGYTLLLTTFLPFAAIGLYRILSNSPSYRSLSPRTRLLLKQLATVCLALPIALSVLSHKEVRFIYPIIGPLHVIASHPVHELFGPLFPPDKPNSAVPKSFSMTIRHISLVALGGVNMIIAFYMTFVHNRGIIDLPNYLRSEFQTHYAASSTAKQNLTLAVFMPCHSLPWRSHLLYTPTSSNPGIQAWALTCEPPLHLSDPLKKAAYLDEADIFYANPSMWIRTHMSRRPPREFIQPQSATDANPRASDIPNIYAAADPASRNRFLNPPPPHPHNDPQEPTVSGLDITDLLPTLRTTPHHHLNNAASSSSETEPQLISPHHRRRRRPWPHYLTFFSALEPTLTRTLKGSGYVECNRLFNSHWHDDHRRQGDIVVWCLFPERAKNRDKLGRAVAEARLTRERERERDMPKLMAGKRRAEKKKKKKGLLEEEEGEGEVEDVEDVEDDDMAELEMLRNLEKNRRGMERVDGKPDSSSSSRRRREVVNSFVPERGGKQTVVQPMW